MTDTLQGLGISDASSKADQLIGAGEFAIAFASGETPGQRALFGLGGLLSIALGVVLFARPDDRSNRAAFHHST